MTNKKLRYNAGEFDGEYVLPIKLFSSSVSGGYNDFVVTNIGRNITISNLHFESYENGTIRSTYSSRFNGIASRMNSIGQTDDRVETFSLELSPTEIQFNKIENRIVIDKGFNGVVNVSNVQSSTSSFGNYRSSGDIVNGIGADSKMWLSDYSGSIPSSQEVASLSGSLDFSMPIRNKTKAEIITRFSAPGAINETTPGYLDFATGQFGVYNTVNYRNRSSRRTIAKENAKHFDIEDLN
jgi:hypothetical protein